MQRLTGVGGWNPQAAFFSQFDCNNVGYLPYLPAYFLQKLKRKHYTAINNLLILRCFYQSTGLSSRSEFTGTSLVIHKKITRI